MPEPSVSGGATASASTPSTTVELSSAQRALWSSQRRHPSSPLQNMALVTHIDGEVDVDRLIAAFEAVVAASAALRLQIVDDRPRHATQPTRTTEIVELARQDVPRWAADRVATPVDVACGVYDSVVLPHDDGTVSWYLCLHHVATDATSSALVFEATAQAYHGAAIDLADLDGTPAIPARRRERADAFWSERSAAPLLDGFYQPVSTRSTASERRPLPVDLDAAQAALDGPYRLISTDLSWTALMMTAAAIHLHRITGAERFALGLPIHHRSAPGRQRVIGPLMEVAPVDVDIAADATIADVHAAVAKQIMNVVANAHPGLGVSASDVSGIVNVIPRGSVGAFGDLPTTTRWIHSGASDPHHLLGVQLTGYGANGLDASIDLNCAAVGSASDRAVAHFVAIVDAMIADPQQDVGAIDLLTEGERVELDRWGSGEPLSASRRDIDPRNARTTGTVLDRLSVALTNSTRPALFDGDLTLTGQQLWRGAGIVAANLRANGVGRGDRVGVEIERSADAVMAMLGVLRAGASYVPIDPADPEARRTEISERAGVVGVLTDLDGIDLALIPDHVPDEAPQPTDEAYVLFTSGSTGEPKGVPISHGGLADYLAFAATSYLGPKQRRPVAPLFTSLGFDLTVTSLFLPLIAGGSLVVIRPSGLPGLQEVARRTDLTWIKATPSHLEALQRLWARSHRITTMVVGGEAFPRRLAEELVLGHPGLDVFNEYGPTEAVVGCMIHRFDPLADLGADVPIGRPAPGVTLRIVDADGRMVPIGAPGELLIASPGLTVGYLGRPSDGPPFVEIDGRRWYRSGDVVRLDGAGRAIYLGRSDDQIKLNGVRLEPAEIEAAIEAHPAVERAVVRPWTPDDRDRPVLAAWIETADGSSIELADLRRFLALRLASNRIPAAMAIVDTLPFNANGKLDTDALPVPSRVRAAVGDETFANSLVAPVVIEAWQTALGLDPASEPIGPADDFFALGGDSLAALEVTAALSERLGVVIDDGLLFATPVLADVVAAIEAAAPAAEPAAGPQPGERPGPLSAGEQAMLFEQQASPDSARYHIGRRYVIEGEVDAERLRAAAGSVVARHAPLHTTFGSPRRRLAVDDALEFAVAEPQTLLDSRAIADRRYRQPFDLDGGPLVRIAVHGLRPENGDEARTCVVVVMHHISGDAGSLDRFWNDLDAAYSGTELAPLEVSYADHARWQRERDRGADVWRGLWAEPVETGLGLPGAAPGDAADRSDGYVERPAGFTASRLRAGPGRTPTATVLGALAALLDRHHRPAERPGRYAIGLTASVREHPTSEPMVGYFLNTLPLVIEVDEGTSVAQLAGRAGDVVGRTLPHRSHPFAEMVAAARREGRQLPIPGVLLAVEDLAAAELGGASAQHEVLASGEAVAEATVFVQLRGERVDLGIEYSGAVLSEQRARLLLDDLDALLVAELEPAGSVADPALPVVLPSSSERLDGGPSPDDTPLIHGILERLGSADHASPAARCGPDRLTWDHLDRRSIALADRLRANGVGPGDRVAVSLDRSVDIVVAIVAVHRIGAVYVPVDPTYPEERRRRILGAADPAIAVVDAGGELPWTASLTLTDLDGSSVDRVDHRDHVVSSDDPAYVIFTSGSTGVPKGVEVTHGQLATSTRARAEVYTEEPERFLLLSSIGFDSSIVGLFWTLSTGGEIVMPTEADAHDPDALLSLIDTARVSHVLMVPTLYQAMLRRSDDDRHWPDVVTVAGEACPPELVAEHHRRRPASALFNEYGPTEATVWATAHRCQPGEVPVPIGRPIPGVWCAVVDADGRGVPEGATGELIIGGVGVARYLDDADGPSPFGHSPMGDGRVYRTGDAVAVGRDARGDSLLYFRGRVDDQLNIGGVRVEPGDIEAVLSAAPGVLGAAVVAGMVAGTDRSVLVAHLDAGDGDIDLAAVLDTERVALPAAMRPARHVVHNGLPTTPHGKIDRAALSAIVVPAVDEHRTATTAPDDLDAHQRTVLDLFARHVPGSIGIDDSFFDVGGDSLGALTLAMDLEDELGRSLSVTALLADPTPRAIAEQLAPDLPPGGLVEWIREGERGDVPLVLLAPGSGHLLGYEPLIRSLDGSTPLLGVRLPGYDGKAAPLRTIEAQADAVEASLLAALAGSGGPSSAVLLGGSSGGLLAWELQRRAELRGDRYRALVMQDTVHPAFRRESDAVGLADQLKQRFTDEGPRAVAMDLYGRADRYVARWRRARASRTAQAATGAELPAVIAQRMFAATAEAVAAYDVPTIDADVRFFAAASTEPDATHARWATSVGSIDVEIFEGDHFGENGITAAANVAPVAARLQQILSELRDR